jgi:hypothetical protein
MMIRRDAHRPADHQVGEHDPAFEDVVPDPATEPSARATDSTLDPTDPTDLGGVPALGAMDPSRPARPGMDRIPAPTSEQVGRPGILNTALGLYYGALGVGTVAVVSAFLWREGSRSGLLDAMVSSTADLATKQRVADLVLYGSLGLMALLLVVELALVSGLATGRRGPRAALTILVPAHVVMLYFVRDVVSSAQWQGTVVEVSLAVQAVVGLVATALAWAPPVGRWLRRRSERRRDPRDPLPQQ